MEWKNKNLSDFVSTILNKNASTISLEDLNFVTSVNISNLSRKDGKRTYGFEELAMFPSLMNVIVKESILSSEDIRVLSQLASSTRSIEFQECFFEDELSLSLLANFQKVSFVGCFHKDFSFVKSLSSLEGFSVEKPYNPVSFDVSLLENSKDLRSLSFEGCQLEHQEKIKDCCSNCARLSLLDTTLSTIDFIDVLPNGAELFLSSEYMQMDGVLRNQSRVTIRSDYSDYVYEMEPVKK